MIDPKTLFPALLRYREPDQWRALFELGVTLLSLVLLWVLMWLSLDVGYWLTLLLAVPAAGFLVRLFMIQHDCGHGAFFRDRAVNDWVGRAAGRSDPDALRLLEAQSRHPSRHVQQSGPPGHRRHRNPDGGGISRAVPDGAHPLSLLSQRHRHVRDRRAYLFLLQHRLPFYQMRDGWRPWVSTMATNAAIALVVAVMIWLVGVGPFLMVHLPIMLLAASMGVWLFYVQHQFEDVVWTRDDGWVQQDAALSGSSYYDLPGVLRWFTANIGIHHVHHLNSRIPYYRLPQVLRDHPELKTVGRLTLWESLRARPAHAMVRKPQKACLFRGSAPIGWLERSDSTPNNPRRAYWLAVT